MQTRATPFHILMAFIAVLPFLLQFTLASRLYGMWAIEQEYELAVMLAVGIGVGYGVCAGALFPLAGVLGKQLTRGALLAGSGVLLLMGAWFALQWLDFSVAGVVGPHPNGSTRNHGMLGNLFIRAYFTTYPLAFALMGFLLSPWYRPPAAEHISEPVEE